MVAGPPAPGVPPPPADPHFLEVTWDAGKPMHRAGLDPYPPNSSYVSPTPARFSPFDDARGTPVPTLYAASSEAGALSESVFHDVPVTGPTKVVEFDDLRDRYLVRLTPQRQLRLASFRSTALHGLGVTRAQLIDTGPIQYPNTARWAAAAHGHRANYDGVLWVSRQDDTAEAVVLFGDRVDCSTELETDKQSIAYLQAPGVLTVVGGLAAEMGVTIAGLPGLR